jgi:germination protein M
MLDDDNYVSRVTTFFDSDSVEDEIRKKIDILTNGKDELYNFHGVIPKDTKLNSIKVNKNEVTLDFSKELYNVSKYIEEEMIEAILYTITEINGIDTVYINVDGIELRNLPNSHKDIPYPLKRSYGINKEYNLNSLNDIDKTTVYFSKSKDDYNYYVPVTEISNKEEEKIDIIIEELKSTINAQNNLNSYFDQNTKLIDYNLDGKKLNLVFNEYIFNNDEYLDREKFILTSSIFENYDINEIEINNKYNFKR